MEIGKSVSVMHWHAMYVLCPNDKMNGLSKRKTITNDILTSQALEQNINKLTVEKFIDDLRCE